jgi:hypothetical protein
MIKIGFDGLSHGDFDSGVMLGRDIHSLVPLGVSAVDFEDNLVVSLLMSWMGDDYTHPLSPSMIGYMPDTNPYSTDLGTSSRRRTYCIRGNGTGKVKEAL